MKELGVAIFGILIQLMWAILFYIYSTNENKYGSDHCQMLRSVGYIFIRYIRLVIGSLIYF